MQEKTYTQLYTLIKGMAGVNNFTTAEQIDITSFVNRRAAEAYNNPGVYWSRFTVVGEARTISSSPAQTIPYTETDLDNIAEFYRIHRDQPWLNQASPEYIFYTDANGAHLIGMTDDTLTSAYVTYKKDLPEYTTASTDIPFEWYNFIAHAAFSDILRKDGQHGRASNEEIYARNLLSEEIVKPSNVNNLNIFGNRISTYINRQTR